MPSSVLPMRRKERALNPDATLSILEKASFGTLATVGPDGTPYAVPLSSIRGLPRHSTWQGGYAAPISGAA